ncbi:uncharacterized protein BP5553_08545 [Venustampulla echinocandica]|uniref:Transcription initiation factor TFIID subunit 2 n=1 Tax=Venustampulla echinocandica TaxID=2656787 RepID=A0A370TEJ9_9HELO|nr:uncharacterized protein BP5553_08545 [Venustampulla echinocandica]RDL33106.1 hypothetical protein BP5553_08545 [Venustampulla echinocandica]
MPGLLLDTDLAAAQHAFKGPEPARELGFTVLHQKLELEIDFTTQSLTGRTEITIVPQTRDLKTIRIHARQCSIKRGKVLVNGLPANFNYEDPMKSLDIPKYVDWGANQYHLQRDRLGKLTGDKKESELEEHAGHGNGTQELTVPKGGDPKDHTALEIAIPKGVRVEEIDLFSEGAATPLGQRSSMGVAARMSVADNMLTPKTATEPAGRFQPLTVSIEFSTNYWRDGLQFVGLAEGDARFPYVYSKHWIDSGTASCIFPCVDDPAMRCLWDVTIKCSRMLGDALKRKPAAVRHHKGALPGKKDLPAGTASTLKEIEEFAVPLSEEEKLLEMVVVCSGELTDESVDLDDSSKKIVKFQCNRVVAPQHIGFAIGPFEQVDLSEFREDEDGEKLGQGQAVQVVGYCLPGRADEVRHTCAPMAHALDHFSLRFGMYPFSQYSLVFVDDQVFDVEHTASLSLCSTRLLIREDIIDPEVENIRTLVHALASQWFGVGIVPQDRGDRWITIGLSHYMAGLFMKDLCGNNEYAFRQKTLTDRLVELDISRPSLYALGEALHVGPFERDFMKLKAPLVLFILDKRIIKASGSAGLTRVLSKLIIAANTGQPEESALNTRDFRRLVDKVTKYRQTEPFWNQWILGSGCPRFSISQKFNKKRLVVEMTISQKQDTLPTQRSLKKPCFTRMLKEELHGVWAGDLQPVFTGPMTIRIHEADGTPYEHIVEIREGVQKIEIPYNTKYKRLKRSRRQKERLAGAAVDISGEGGDDALYYCLGDVLQTPADVAEWGLADWDAETEARMDQESYEWIRIDADFEWLCEKSFTSMPSYMYISQLQQDRDVVAQQESMLFLSNTVPHNLVSTFLVRTLMDTRYFHGIRTMAAGLLQKHAALKTGWIGLKHLEKAYHEFFCYPDSKMARSNDFTDKRAYWVETSIPKSLAQIRDTRGDCPKEARQLILDMLRFNDNGNNEYSDNHKVANLLSCLADSLIPVREEGAGEVFKGDDEEEEDEPSQFKTIVLDELDRYRRMDEWIDSYQNIYTTTVLDCKRRLMKAKVIPIEPLDFAQYLHDGTSDFVRIKAFEALMDLGFLTNNAVASLLLNVLSTDSSPYTRHHLFERLFLGLATVASGENKPIEPPPPAPNGDVEMQTEEDGLIVQDASTEARQAHIARTTSIFGAVAALKEDLKGNAAIKTALWKAIKSSVIGVYEQRDLLDICNILYEAVESMIVKLKLPCFWKVEYLGKGHLVFKQTGKVRKAPRKPILNVKPPKVSLGTAAPPARPAPPQVRLSFTSNAGAMRPPKRPLPVEATPSSEGPPAKKRIVKLKVPSAKLLQIQSLPPKPTIKREKSSPSSQSSSTPRPSPKVSPVISVASVAASTTSASSAPASLAVPPSTPGDASRVKVRKPLPDSAGGRKPLPGAPPKPRTESAPVPLVKKTTLKLKLKTPSSSQPPPS